MAETKQLEVATLISRIQQEALTLKRTLSQRKALGGPQHTKQLDFPAEGTIPPTQSTLSQNQLLREELEKSQQDFRAATDRCRRLQRQLEVAQYQSFTTEMLHSVLQNETADTEKLRRLNVALKERYVSLVRFLLQDMSVESHVSASGKLNALARENEALRCILSHKTINEPTDDSVHESSVQAQKLFSQVCTTPKKKVSHIRAYSTPVTVKKYLLGSPRARYDD